MAKELKPTRVITGKVRLSYVHVFEKWAAKEEDTPKYSVQIMVDKDDKKLLKKLEAAIEAAQEEGKAMWGGKIPRKIKLPLRVGEDERDEEEYQDVIFFNASSNNKPGVIDLDKIEITDPADLYSGCYARVSLNFYPFKGAQNGVAVGLNNIQKVAEGERLGGSMTSAEDDFDDDYEDDDDYDLG